MRADATKFGIFAMVSAILMVILYNTMSNQLAGDSRGYTAIFTNVSGLRSGDDVRAAGVSVGRVQSVDVDRSGRARVGFILGEQQDIYADTSMVVRYQNLLGQRYVALVPGSASTTRLPTGSTVPVERTSPGFDLTALLNGFEPLFATIDPADINELASTMIAVLQGEGGTIESLLEQTATVSSSLADDDEVLGQVVDNLLPVLQNLSARGDDFDRTVDQLRALTTGLAKESATIGDSIDGISELADATADLITAARPDLDGDIKRLGDLSTVLVDNRSQLEAVLDKLPLATGAFARPMSYGSYLNVYLCNLTVDLGGIRIDLGNPEGPYSPVCR